MYERLREELKSMAAEDRQLRQELLDRGEMGDGYAPRMEALHRKNAARLKEIIDEHGWPDSDLVGEDGTHGGLVYCAARNQRPQIPTSGIEASPREGQRGKGAGCSRGVFVRPHRYV